MDKILNEAVDNIVEIFIVDAENVALAKGAVFNILKNLVDEKLTSANNASQKLLTQILCAYAGKQISTKLRYEIVDRVGAQLQAYLIVGNKF